MRLFRYRHASENPQNRDMNERNEKVGDNLATALVTELIEGIRYEFGKPWKLTAESLSAVVPILRKFDRERNYLLAQEIEKDTIHIADSGRIGKISVVSRETKKPVFVRAGTIFKGDGTQSRTSSTGVILDPTQENLVDVFCVHASQGISAFSNLSTMRDVVPRKVEEVLLSPQKNQTSIWHATAVRRPNQSVTECPHCRSSRLMQTYEAEIICVQCGRVITSTSRSSTDQTSGRTNEIPRVTIAAHSRAFSARLEMPTHDSLISNLEKMRQFNRNIENLLSKVPADLSGQVGILVIDSKGVQGLEMFDHPDSWRAFSSSIVRNYIDVLAKERSEEGLFNLNEERIPHAISMFLEKARALTERTMFKNRIGETRMLSGELVGEYTCIGSYVIHLILKR